MDARRRTNLGTNLGERRRRRRRRTTHVFSHVNTTEAD
jgi:hypothetical protein